MVLSFVVTIMYYKLWWLNEWKQLSVITIRIQHTEPTGHTENTIQLFYHKLKWILCSSYCNALFIFLSSLFFLPSFSLFLSRRMSWNILYKKYRIKKCRNCSFNENNFWKFGDTKMRAIVGYRLSLTFQTYTYLTEFLVNIFICVHRSRHRVNGIKCKQLIELDHSCVVCFRLLFRRIMRRPWQDR